MSCAVLPLACVPAPAPDPSHAARTPSTAPPAELLARQAAAGDVRAFTALVERYHARCLRFARNLGLPAQDAEEAVQDAFVRVYGALPRFREDARFEPWLFRVLANRCRSSHARARWYRRAVAQSDAELAARSAPDDSAAVVDAECLRDVVARALAELPAEQREAFLLRHVEEWSYDDIARATGARHSTLRMRVKRACDSVRARLQREGIA